VALGARPPKLGCLPRAQKLKMLVGHGKGDNRYFYPGRRKNVSARPNFVTLPRWEFAKFLVSSVCVHKHVHELGMDHLEFHPAESNEHLRAFCKNISFLLSKAVSRNVKFQIQSC
jgi:hypothetical protein